MLEVDWKSGMIGQRIRGKLAPESWLFAGGGCVWTGWRWVRVEGLGEGEKFSQISFCYQALASDDQCGDKTAQLIYARGREYEYAGLALA